MVQSRLGRRGTPAERRHLLIGRTFTGSLAAILTGLGILSATVAGCSTSKAAGGKSILGPLFSKGVDSRAEKEALKKAVEKDPFPRAKSRPVDLDA